MAAEGAGKAAEALGCYREAIDADPGFALAHMNLGIALHAGGEPAAAIAAHQRAIALDPGSAAAHYNLALAHLATGQAVQAEAEFREALRLGVEFPEAWVGLAEALESLGRDREALEALDTAIGQREHYPGAQFNASVLLMMSKSFAPAAVVLTSRFSVLPAVMVRFVETIPVP
jgi:tetratricopeptide (TPR) repeat protein